MRITVTDTAGEQLIFDWDPSTGALSGPDGWWIDRMLGLWSNLLILAGADQFAPDPRRSPLGMAYFLEAHDFTVPDELRAAVPPVRLSAVGADN